MTAGRPRLVVVGGGVIGTMHAVSGRRRGYDVVQIERDVAPRGASLRNFGLIWVSGRASGSELELALVAREIWEAIAKECEGTGFRPSGSLTVATRPDELAALETAASSRDAEERQFRLLSAPEAATIEPALADAAHDGRVLGALYCPLDAIVEPRLVLGALRNYLDGLGSYRYLPARQVMEFRPHAVRDDRGDWHEGDLVVCCPGADTGGFLASALADAPLRRVRLQMLETEPFSVAVASALADGDSLRYYPAYAGAPREKLAPQSAVAREWGAQLLLVQRLSGHLTIGDTHRYEEPFAFDLDEIPYRHLLSAAAMALGALPDVERRWEGIYLESTDERMYYRREIAPGVVVVTGPGGRGMTMAPAIAEETFR